MVVISIDTVGAEKFERGFNRYVEYVKDFSEIYEQIYMDFLSVEREQFASEGSRGGERWQPLSENYAKWKYIRYSFQPILVAMGFMRSALTHAGGIGAEKEIQGRNKYARFGIDSTTIHTGTSKTMAEIAEYHQLGTRRMPVRKVVDLTEADKNRWAKSIQSWAYAKLKNAVEE